MPITKLISIQPRQNHLFSVHPTVPSKHLLQCSPLCWAIAKADDVLPTSYREAVSHGEVCHMGLEVVGWFWEEMTFRFDLYTSSGKCWFISLGLVSPILSGISQIHITPNASKTEDWEQHAHFLQVGKILKSHNRKWIKHKNPVGSDSNTEARAFINCAWNWHSSLCSFHREKQKDKETHVLTDHVECNESYSMVRWVVIIFNY